VVNGSVSLACNEIVLTFSFLNVQTQSTVLLKQAACRLIREIAVASCEFPEHLDIDLSNSLKEEKHHLRIFALHKPAQYKQKHDKNSVTVVVLPGPFRRMGVRRNSTADQQLGHAPRSGPEVKNGKVMPKMAHRRGTDAE